MIQLPRHIASAVVVLSLFAPVPTLAWMNDGHEIVAEIAEARLSARTKDAVDALLAAQGLETMAQASGWADVVHYVPGIRQPSHIVRIPLDRTPYDPARDCPGRRCAVAAVEDFAAVLADPDQSLAVRIVALNFVIHLVGDLHQPLHTSADTGQRMVEIEGGSLRLHDLWDDLIVRRRGRSPAELAREIADGRSCAPEVGLAPSDWAIEGRDIARDRIFSDPRLKAEGMPRLDSAYLEEAWPVVGERLWQAGCRLAELLGASLDGAR